MSVSKAPSRRQFLLLASLLSSVKAIAGEKQKASGDNGIGGTGYRPGDNGIGGTGYRPGDNGIGGTGFIGTIRKFGSVYINGQRIVYPADAAIEIDGARVEARDMRIGQVARLVADRSDKTWTTQRIVIVSEVVGPVERISGKNLAVLGQRVQLPNAKIARALKIGDRIAISGLRRPDQTIVASAVERREGGLDQIAGVVSRDAGGAMRIGDQNVTGVGDALAGQRVVARGGLDNGVFVARETKKDSDIAIGGVRNVSIETWVKRQDGALETANGVRVDDRAGAVQPGSHHVIINGEIGANGGLIAHQLEFVSHSGDLDPRGGGSGGGGPRGGGGFEGGGGSGGGGHPAGGYRGGGLPGGGGFGGGGPGGLGGGYPGGAPGGGGLGGALPGSGVPGGGGLPGTGLPDSGFSGGNIPGGGMPGGGLPGGGFGGAPPGSPPGGGIGGPGGFGGPPGRFR